MEKLIPVVVIKELSETDKILTALKNNGINCAEITFRTACAKEAIEYACKNYPDMSIGAGTVINAQQCRDALEAGADDMQHDGTIYEVYTDPDAFQEVYNALEAAGYKFVSAQVEMVPQNYITVTDETDVKNLTKMLDMFEDNDDVQNVWHNWENA